eukprot:tig00000836_g4699.t1
MLRSGVRASPALADVWGAEQQDPSKRALRVQVVSNAAEETASVPLSGSLQADFPAVTSLLPDTPSCCYILLRGDGGRERSPWMFISYVPEGCGVKDKMLHSSSRESLKKELGAQFEDVFISSRDELSLAAFEERQRADRAEKPLTALERLQLADASEAAAPPPGARQTYLHRVAVQAAPELREQLAALAEARANLLELTVRAGERLEAAGPARTVPPGGLAGERLPENEPRFLVHRFEHRRAGAAASATLFVFYCPEGAPPRLRMVHSTAKSSALEAVEAAGLPVSKTLEVRAASELTEAALLEELYPSILKTGPAANPLAAAPVAAPAKPPVPGRGPRRLVPS